MSEPNSVLVVTRYCVCNPSLLVFEVIFRVHANNAAKFPAVEKVISFAESATSFASSILICVGIHRICEKYYLTTHDVIYRSELATTLNIKPISMTFRLPFLQPVWPPK
jgi:hypothetical protein